MEGYFLNLLENLNILKSLKQIPQNPEFHKEGNVFNHTKMVLNALFSNKLWDTLNRDEKYILGMSAIFHDIGKLNTTVKKDGKITSPFHSVVGANIVKELLWKEIPEKLSFDIRHKIILLVRFHTFPAMFLHKKNYEKNIIRLSLNIKLKHLYMLSIADIMGRITDYKKEFLESVELFKSCAEELECFEKPFKFYNSHTRFKYFNGSNVDKNSQIFDNTEFEVILMSGLPGSGKDYWIKNNIPENIPVISLDKIREELKISPDDNQGAVVQEAKKRARALLRDKQDFVWNATNVTTNIRKQLINFFSKYKARIKIVYIDKT